MFSLVKRFRSRLVQRIYLVGLIQFVIVAAGIVALSRQPREPSPLMDTVNFVARSLAEAGDEPAGLQRVADEAFAVLHWSLAVYGARGEVLASAGSAPALLAHDPPRPGPPPTRSVHIVFATGGRATLVVAPPPPLPPPGVAGLGATALLVLVVVSVSSWLTARSLAAPLARLAVTANAFGAGQLAARAGMGRSDELGDVARAFDGMADRLTKGIRAERELLANISHELRTPLQRIRIALDLASEGDAATARESLGEINEDLGELERIVDDVLTATRLSLKEGGGPSSAAPPIRPEPVEISGLVDRAAARFRAANPGRQLDVSVADGIRGMSGDSMLLRRVVDNVLENAHKYTEDPAAPIVLAASPSPEGVVLEVRDRGIGIETADLERVFEPFYRVDRSRTRATGGLGLGLALARRIVGAHGGTIGITSEPGRGTIVRIALPLAPPVAAPPTPSQSTTIA